MIICKFWGTIAPFHPPKLPKAVLSCWRLEVLYHSLLFLFASGGVGKHTFDPIFLTSLFSISILKYSQLLFSSAIRYF